MVEPLHQEVLHSAVLPVCLLGEAAPVFVGLGLPVSLLLQLAHLIVEELIDTTRWSHLLRIQAWSDVIQAWISHASMES